LPHKSVTTYKEAVCFTALLSNTVRLIPFHPYALVDWSELRYTHLTGNLTPPPKSASLRSSVTIKVPSLSQSPNTPPGGAKSAGNARKAVIPPRRRIPPRIRCIVFMEVLFRGATSYLANPGTGVALGTGAGGGTAFFT
jgi:hypothetical protein